MKSSEHSGSSHSRRCRTSAPPIDAVNTMSRAPLQDSTQIDEGRQPPLLPTVLRPRRPPVPTGPRAFHVPAPRRTKRAVQSGRWRRWQTPQAAAATTPAVRAWLPARAIPRARTTRSCDDAVPVRGAAVRLGEAGDEDRRHATGYEGNAARQSRLSQRYRGQHIAKTRRRERQRHDPTVDGAIICQRTERIGPRIVGGRLTSRRQRPTADEQYGSGCRREHSPPRRILRLCRPDGGSPSAHDCPRYVRDGAARGDSPLPATRRSRPWTQPRAPQTTSTSID